jgi:hypothetical protein
MKLAVVLLYLDTLTPGQIELARSIKSLSNPEVRGYFCGPKIDQLNEFSTNSFATLPDIGKGFDGVIYSGLTTIDAEYVWFFGDDYLHPDALKIISGYLLSQKITRPVLLATESVANLDQLDNCRSNPPLPTTEVLSGDEAFLRYKDQLGFISRLIFAPRLLEGQTAQIEKFMGTNWVSISSYLMHIHPKKSSTEVAVLNDVIVYGIERDQRQEIWYNYETFLYHTLEAVQELISKGYSFNPDSVVAVSRNIIWRALKARAVHKLEGITNGYANNWNFSRLKPLLPRSVFWLTYLGYKLDFALIFAARIKRWKRRFL